ncbi:Delta-9 desaturase 1 [Gryllus bimaculatus]|nr:Delta-9 desaturase 1 [Gryllus bimaculatus]
MTTAELGNYRANFTTAFIDFFALIGWAYDLKTVPVSTIQRRVERTGDGSHDVWGWGDKDMPQEHIDEAVIKNRKTLTHY